MITSPNYFLIQEFKGDATSMMEHLKSDVHIWAYFYRLYGDEFNEEDYELQGNTTNIGNSGANLIKLVVFKKRML